MTPRLIFVAHAVAPGRPGAEALVNAELLRALAAHWPGSVTVISGGEAPTLADGEPLSALPGWRVHALGECGASEGSPSLLSVLAQAGVRRIRRGGPASIPARLAERGVYLGTGLGLKSAAWTRAAARALADELEREPGAVVYSRALPFSSILAADAVRRRRRFRWLVNLNDPLPPEIWPGQYALDPRAGRRMRQAMAALLPRVDGFTFPSEQLRGIEVGAFPEMARTPFEIVRHVAGPAGPAEDGREERALHLAFAGTLRRDRCRPELAEALARLRAREEVRISFFVPHSMPALAGYAEGLPAATRVVVGLPEEELRRELARADVLLDPESEVDGPLLMTKLASYSAYGKPVWSLCARGGTTWELLGATGWGWRSALGEPESAAATLAEILDDRDSGRLARRSASPAVADLFSPRRQVEALLRLVERVAA
ncbi:MAG TPA: glycosyltransferase [Thermoanaerobaculia bacterium]|jgi:glycosyltransferase involved in cell wall biosynthesis|nr:glycosyltransferase [Thermoanaerobaculia bacterium]